MSHRFTKAEKWRENKWFKDLEAHAKLLWFYLQDNCNIAGIWQIDIPQAAHDLRLNEELVWQAFKEIEECYVSNADYLMLVDFIHDQNNFPLNPKNPVHRGIATKLEEHKDLYVQAYERWRNRGYIEIKLFDNVQEGPLEDLQRTLGNSNSKGKGKSNTGGAGGKTRLLPIPGKCCSKKGCGMPAVHRITSGAGYDFWYCPEHLPEKVKAKYE